MTDRTDDALKLARIREVLRDPDLYDSYNSITTRCLVRDIKQAMGLELNGTTIPEPDPPAAAIDADHLDRQRAWSENTFGPYPRLAGVVDHIRKELIEVVDSDNDLSEWVDVIMLAFDGACGTGASSQEIIDAIAAKLEVNEARTWPDWRTADRTKAIEHVRT
ncbi:dATP/dGTP pyrophosphohydrolase domain-containing protein [Mycolicibacterium canariasense]|uniref:dATP/dGTP pyrophosphohydrolase domain-containing protein n=1 Tax=Mycolicibacterium canariasense TaxID=228230 RepID=UPI000A157CE2|nr:dATP/dGTP pyrophosphohydrolase domain-containing protein [Mycolicibacterium canariasense]